MNIKYQLGLLYLVHLLVGADGSVDEKESAALEKIRKSENISEEVFAQFKQDIATKKERDIYQEGTLLIGMASVEEKLRAFVILYKLSEVDGTVHVKEVRLLLYSIKMAGIEFDDVVKEASKISSM